ncbi:MAG: alpha/beta hydrolase [Phycisphaerales bacterium]
MLLSLYAVWLVVACSFQTQILFPGATAWNTLTRPTDRPGPAWERWALERPDGAKGVAWFRPAEYSGTHAPAAIFFHGNGDIAPNRTDMGDVYSAMGVHTLLVEYPGYDESQGVPGEAAIVEDALLALDRLLEREDVDPGRLIFHGHSIGGGAAAQLAARRTPAVLILESTFTSMRAMVRRYLVPTAVLRHPFDTMGVLETLAAPVLVMHGDLDVIIFPVHAERNARAARDATLVRFPSYGHDGCYLAPNYPDVLADFLRTHAIIDE